MKTTLPPLKEQTDIVSAKIQPLDPYAEEFAPIIKKRCKTAAMLSLIPGLGQLFNGEIGKGSLFLTIGGANLAVFLACFFSAPSVQALTGVAGHFQRQPNWDLAKPFESLVSSPALFIYVALVISFVAFAMRDAYDRAKEVARAGKRPPRFELTLPEATSGSYLAHFAIMATFVIAVLFFISPKPPQHQITQIELVQPERPKPPEPPRARPQPKLEPKPVVQPKPVPKVTPKVEPPKPTPVAVAVPTNAPSPLTTDQSAPIPEAQPAAPPAPSAGGGSGDGPAGDGDGQEIDMGPYMSELQRRIKKAWFPPKGNETKRVVVSFHVKKNGSLRGNDVKIERSSGVNIADEAAEDAVINAAPFPPLPAGAGDEIDIKFTFDYNVFGGSRTPHQW